MNPCSCNVLVILCFIITIINNMVNDGFASYVQKFAYVNIRSKRYQNLDSLHTGTTGRQ